MHRYYMTRRSVAPGAQPKGFASWQETEGGKLTNGSRCYAFVDYARELSPEEIEEYELTPHSDSVQLCRK